MSGKAGTLEQPTESNVFPLVEPSGKSWYTEDEIRPLCGQEGRYYYDSLQSPAAKYGEQQEVHHDGRNHAPSDASELRKDSHGIRI